MNNLPKALTRQERELKRFVELSWNFCKCVTLDLLFNPWKCCLKTSSHIFKFSPSLTYSLFSIQNALSCMYSSQCHVLCKL